MHPGKYAAIALILIATSFLAVPAHAEDDHSSVVIVYKDGHRQALVSEQIVRIDLRAPATIIYKDGRREKIKAEIERIEFGDQHDAMLPARSHFIGKWEVGDGAGNKFFITLEPDGDATKSIGGHHGTWTLVDGEAHVTWDDGWHDAIRKTGGSHEKLAYEPGIDFSHEPSNVAEAHKADRKPI